MNDYVPSSPIRGKQLKNSGPLLFFFQDWRHFLYTARTPHFTQANSPLPSRSEERLIREVMAVDEVDWDEAHLKVSEV